VLVAKGHNVLVEPDGSTAGAPERLLRFFSYFTVQSNILAILGAISGWYPYPFLDADEHGTGRVLLNAVVVTVLLVGLALVFLAVDRWLAERADRPTPATSPEGVN
jgi:hypothetical protein